MDPVSLCFYYNIFAQKVFANYSSKQATDYFFHNKDIIFEHE